MTPRRALVLLIAISAAMRLAWAASLGPGNDEAYFLGYTQHLDFSYFDHPPMVAWIAWLGLKFSSILPTAFAMRLCFVALFCSSTWLISRFTARFFGDWAGFYAALLFSATGYFGLAAGSFALPDGPLVFFWILTLDRVALALCAPPQKRRSLSPWVLVGLAWGGALLSKYHALLIPMGVGAFLVLEPRGRAWLRRPGPYLAFGMGLLLFSPVIGWNLAHGGSSFAFQGSRAFAEHWWPRPDRFGLALLGQILYAFPWIWLILMAALWKVFRTSRRGASGLSERFLAVQSLVPLFAFWTVGAWQTLLPHWSLTALIAIFPLAGRDFSSQDSVSSARFRYRVLACSLMPWVVAGVILLHTNAGILQKEGTSLVRLLTPSVDPSLDLYGWSQVTQALKDRGLLADANTYLFTSKWYHTSQLAFALGGDIPVLCYSRRAALGFADWSTPESWVGRNGILAVVNHSSTEPAAFESWFERVEALGSVTVHRAGAPVKTVRLYYCARQQHPFPFSETKSVEASMRHTGQIARQIFPSSNPTQWR